MNNVSVAVIGLGYWGKNLVRNYHELGALKILCDINEKTLGEFKEQYPNVVICESVDDVLLRQDIEAVVISTPAETHYDLVRQALLAEKHVFVEKPLSLMEKEGFALVELAEQSQLTLMVGHILQYHPAVIKLKQLIDSGELGKIQYLYSNRLNIGKIRSEENILWSFAPHDISVILMLLGEIPHTIYATGGSYLQQEVPDTTLTTLDFPSGVKAHIFVSWLHPFKEQKLVVVGDRKMAVFDDLSQEKLALYPHRIQWLQRIPVAAKAEAEVVSIEMEEPLRAECRHFLECIIQQRTPKTDGREGLRVLQVLQGSQESIDQNGCKIRLVDELNSEPKKRNKLPEIEESAGGENLQGEGVFVHQSSYIDDGVKIGMSTKVWHFSHVLRGSKIGDNCNIGQNVVIGPNVSIGNGCKIQNNVSIYEGVTLEDGVFCGPSMVFTNVYNPRAEIKKMEQLRPTIVKKGATIGANATIVCGTTIGQYAFVGAGAVITRNVPDYALVVGNPVRQIGWVCHCGERLSDILDCNVCGNTYKKNEDDLEKQIQIDEIAI